MWYVSQALSGKPPHGAVAVRPQMSYQGIVGIERLTAAGAVPNTTLALVTELFRDWKSPRATKAREIILWHGAELQKLGA